MRLAEILSLEELLRETGGHLARRVAGTWTGVSIDGRTARTGDLYFAIQGERLDGHAFLRQAVDSGATGLVVATRIAGEPETATLVEVADTRVALGQMARAVRRRSPARIVGVTGSTGKTTTKELIAAMMAEAAGSEAVVATERSLNNETGVPLTLARLRPHHVYAVVEMGMRGLGQIATLAGWAEPDVGVVVNAGVAHVGVVGSAEAVVQGKSEIWAGLRPGGWAVYPKADARLAARAAEHVPPERRVTFGLEPGADVRVCQIVTRGEAGLEVRVLARDAALAFRLSLVGRHNAENAACALAVALALGLDLRTAARGLEKARPASQRSELSNIGGRWVLVDCYNANPVSMRAAVETLADLAAGAGTGAVAILGDMAELGDQEKREHEAVGELLGTRHIDRLVCMGERARHTARAAAAAGVKQVLTTEDPVAAAAAAVRWSAPGDFVLVKASRVMRLERVVEALRNAVDTDRTG